MGFLPEGAPFPDFKLGDTDTSASRATGPLLVALWRQGCSTSRLAVPFLDRLQASYPGLTVVGVSQDGPNETRAYVEREHLEAVHVSDEDFGVSERFQITHVPTFFLTDATGTILFAQTGWNVSGIEDLSGKIAGILGVEPQPIVTQADAVPLFKPG
jgi:peroxiredoxin